MASVVKIGLIGCGNVAMKRHLPILQSFKDVEITTLADTDMDRLDRAIKKFGALKAFEDYRALIEDSTISTVVICTPPESHAEIAHLAIQAGKHLFIEKPLALSVQDCDKLITLAKQSSLKIMVGFKLRWHRLVRQAKNLLSSEVLGPVKAIRYVATCAYREHEPEWLKYRRSGGGMLIEYGVHMFDLWRHLLVSEVEEVFAISQTGFWEDETASLTARMANGVQATAILSKGTGENHEIEIYGGNGRLRISRYRIDGLEYYPKYKFPGNINIRIENIARTLKSFSQVISSFRQGGDHMACYNAQWDHFISAIQQNTEVKSTLKDGRYALQAVMAAVESTSKGNPVRIV